MAGRPCCKSLCLDNIIIIIKLFICLLSAIVHLCFLLFFSLSSLAPCVGPGAVEQTDPFPVWMI